MLASPSPALARLEDTVVVGIHPVELRCCPPRRALLGTLDVLLFGKAGGGRRWRTYGSRTRLSRRLLGRLGERGSRQQGQGKKGEDGGETHLCDLQLMSLVFYLIPRANARVGGQQWQGCIRFMSHRQKRRVSKVITASRSRYPRSTVDFDPS